MRIAYSTYPWAFDCPGGGERQLLAYKEALTTYSLSVELFDQWRPVLGGLDIFHFFSAMPGSLQILDYVKRKGIKICVSPNLWITQDTAHLYPAQDVGNVLSLADKIIVNSRAEIVGLKEVYGFPDERFSVVYNGYSPIYSRQHGDQGRLFREACKIDGEYMLNIANVEPRKNQLEFIRELKRSGIDRRLAIVGNIRDQEYAKQCFEVGGDQVTFVGPLEYASPEMVSAISGASTFVMPSMVETPSIAALEAFAMGVPLLITERGCTSEYFGQYAQYVNPEDLSDLSKKLLALKSTELAPVEIRSRYSWPNVASELFNVYRALSA